VCVDTPDHTNGETATEMFTITAPATDGTYDVSFITWSDNACSSDASATFTLTGGIVVCTTPTASLTVSNSCSGAVCSGSSCNITIASSVSGTNYQLRNNSDNSNVGSAVAGTAGTINLPTGNLTSTTTFNILATNATTGCAAQLTTTQTITVNALP